MEVSRRKQVGEILVSKPFTSLAELEERFPEVSSMTLRRDIEYFEEQGDVIKVRGGARALRFINLSKEEGFYKRAIENTEAKQRIAGQAARFIEGGRSLFFDSGSTVLQLVSFLPKERLNILTADPTMALEIIKNDDAVVNLVGGCLGRDNLSLSGAQAVEYIERTNIDIAFMSPSGWSTCGFTGGNYNESEFKSRVMAKAQTVIMLVQSAKIGKSLPHTFAQPEDVSILITDTELPEELQSQCEQHHVQVIIAK